MTRSEPTTPRTGASVPSVPLGKPHASEAARLPAELEGRAPLTYRGEPVLTTELAARAFGAEEKALRNNFDRNEGRFEEGKHFYRVEGAELRALKDSTSFRGSVGANARTLTLWTERGIARHAKILETETAWEIFEALEDSYFRMRAAPAAVPIGEGAARTNDAADARKTREARLLHKHLLGVGKMAGLVGNQLLIAANRGTTKETGFDVLGSMGITHLIAPVNDPLVIPSKLGMDLGLGKNQGRRVNTLLLEEGLQERTEDRDGSCIWRPTAKGAALGGQLVDVERNNGTGADQQLKWPLAATLEVLRAAMGAAAPREGGEA